MGAAVVCTEGARSPQQSTKHRQHEQRRRQQPARLIVNTYEKRFQTLRHVFRWVVPSCFLLALLAAVADDGAPVVTIVDNWAVAFLSSIDATVPGTDEAGVVDATSITASGPGFDISDCMLNCRLTKSRCSASSVATAE